MGSYASSYGGDMGAYDRQYDDLNTLGGIYDDGMGAYDRQYDGGYVDTFVGYGYGPSSNDGYGDGTVIGYGGDY